MQSRPCSLPPSQKASETDGLMWPPLNRPSGERATSDPLPAKHSPVTNSRRLWLGIHCAITVPSPKSKTTALNPKKTRHAVPTNSAAYSGRCEGF
jgi:hypothetical protein